MTCIRRRSLALLAGSLLLPACTSLFKESNLSFQVPESELRDIQAVRLTDHALSDPVSLDEAAPDDLAIAIESPPADEITLNIADVRMAALQHNLDLHVELVNPSIARTSITQEEAAFESTFFGTYDFSNTNNPNVLATIQGTQSQVNAYDLGVRVPLVTGGEITFDVPWSDSRNNNPSALSSSSYNASARFSISQNLLRGAGPRANLHPLRVAKGNAQITDAQTKLEAIRILANADRAYWLLYAAQQELIVRRQEYELAMRQLETATRRVDAGDLPRIEITRAQSGVAERLDAILVADNAVRRTQRDLKRIMNRPDLPIDSPTRIVLDTEPNPLWLDLDAEEIAHFAVEHRMEMLELELQLAIDASQIDFDKNQALPLFVVDYTYRFDGLGLNSFTPAFQQVRDRDFGNQFLSLRAEVPIGNMAAKSQVHRSILTRLQRLGTKAARTLSIRQEVFDAIDSMDEAWQRILAARQAARLAGRTYEAEERQFTVGLRTSTDVLDAATRLADAQSSEVRALTDYQISMVDLAFATGTLLGKDMVRWTPIDVDPAHARDVETRDDIRDVSFQRIEGGIREERE